MLTQRFPIACRDIPWKFVGKRVVTNTSSPEFQIADFPTFCVSRKIGVTSLHSSERKSSKISKTNTKVLWAKKKAQRYCHNLPHDFCLNYLSHISEEYYVKVKSQWLKNLVTWIHTMAIKSFKILQTNLKNTWAKKAQRCCQKNSNKRISLQT